MMWRHRSSWSIKSRSHQMATSSLNHKQIDLWLTWNKRRRHSLMRVTLSWTVKRASNSIISWSIVIWLHLRKKIRLIRKWWSQYLKTQIKIQYLLQYKPRTKYRISLIHLLNSQSNMSMTRALFQFKTIWKLLSNHSNALLLNKGQQLEMLNLVRNQSLAKRKKNSCPDHRCQSNPILI